MTQSVLRQRITERLVEALGAGKVPWRTPWACDANCGSPASISSQRNYTGINVLLLQLTAQEQGYASRWWGTFRRWRELGGQVRKGEKATTVVFMKPVVKKRLVDGEETEKGFSVLRRYSVFNLDQVDGESLSEYRPGQVRQPPISDVLLDWTPAREAVEATGADIRYGGDAAYYARPIGGDWPNHTDGDFIHVPEPHRFSCRADRYSVLFHELTHWSEVRLGLEGSYAFNELRAEIAACYCLSELGLPQSDDLENHGAYLRSWLRAMGDDPQYIIRAASEASRVTDYLLSFSRDREVAEIEAVAQV